MRASAWFRQGRRSRLGCSAFLSRWLLKWLQKRQPSQGPTLPSKSGPGPSSRPPAAPQGRTGMDTASEGGLVSPGRLPSAREQESVSFCSVLSVSSALGL